MAVDLSADHAVIAADFPEAGPIALSSWPSPPNPPITDAYRLEDTKVEGDPSEGGYLQRQTEWHLSTLQAYSPAVGETITDADGVVWIIQSLRESVRKDFWGLTCLESSITADVALEDRVWLWPATYEVSAMGSQVTKHLAAAPGFSDVPAKIVLRPSLAETEMGQRDFVEIFDVYVSADIGQVHDGDLLKDATDHQYTIVSYRNRFHIDDLSHIVCEDRLRGP